MPGKTLRITLVDGTPNGIITAEIMNWTGRLIIAPRSQLAQLSRREEVKRSGIYILKGNNPKDPTQEKVYIGESDNVLDRLALHNKDVEKDFWERTIIVVSSDENLTKSHVRYLEGQLIQIAKEAKRAEVVNNQNPKITNLPIPEIIYVEEFLSQIQLVLPVLGLDFITPLPIVIDQPKTTTPVFCMTYGGASARAMEVENEFIVLKGSTARKAITHSLADLYIHLRERLVREGQLVDSQDERYWRFAQNVPFNSPSTAANTVGGALMNGRQLWKVEGTNQTYAIWTENQIHAATQSEQIEEKGEELNSSQKVNIIWKDMREFRDRGFGHGIEFHDTQRDNDNPVAAFLDGFGWYRGEEEHAIVYCINPDQYTGAEALDELKIKIHKIIESKYFAEGKLDERFIAIPNC